MLTFGSLGKPFRGVFGSRLDIREFSNWLTFGFFDLSAILECYSTDLSAILEILGCSKNRLVFASLEQSGLCASSFFRWCGGGAAGPCLTIIDEDPGMATSCVHIFLLRFQLWTSRLKCFHAEDFEGALRV